MKVSSDHRPILSPRRRIRSTRQRFGVRQFAAAFPAMCDHLKSARGLAQSKSFARSVAFSIVILAGGFATPCFPTPADYFRIAVVDEQTGRGVPLVELETVNHLRFYTDSAGVVAFFEPALMNRDVFFHVRSHGYEFKKDGFGYAGKTLAVKPGGSAELKLKRLNIAERLYRVTGEGIYRDTVLLGGRAPIAEPLLNAQVAGQDTVMALPYRGRLHWFWGDTLRPKYPLGHFGTAGATSELSTRGGLDPAVGVDLRYFAGDDGFSRPMIKLGAPGPVWVHGAFTLNDPSGHERLVAHYMRMKNLGEMLEHGLVMFNDEQQRLDKLVEFDLKEKWRRPHGHPVRFKDTDGEFIYFPAPFANVRVRAVWQAVTNQSRYESLSLTTNAAGRLKHEWQTNSAPLTQKAERELVRSGKLRPEEARLQMTDVDSGKPVEMHSGSICWNEFRKRWVMIAGQSGGTSYLGEIWFAESESLTGPWRLARKIVTHERYSFYNPAQHSFFDQQGGRVIYFEGTYTAEFSGNPVKTPRYDYNQIMYRLDLTDARLGLPLERKD